MVIFKEIQSLWIGLPSYFRFIYFRSFFFLCYYLFAEPKVREMWYAPECNGHVVALRKHQSVRAVKTMLVFVMFSGRSAHVSNLSLLRLAQGLQQYVIIYI